MIDAAALDDLAPAVDALLAAMPEATIFNSPDWLAAAYAMLHRDRAARLLGCWVGDRLVALLPLTYGQEVVNRLPLRTLRLAGYPLTDRAPIMLAGDQAGRLDEVLDALAGIADPWDAIVLNELPHEPMVLAAIEHWSKGSGFTAYARLASRAPVLWIDGRDAAAVAAAYPKSLATRLRRSRKKLAGAGAVRFERVQPDLADLPRLLDRIKAIEDASWKGKSGVGIFSTPERFAFFRHVSERFAARSWLDLGLLQLDGQMITYRYGFRFDRRFWDYNFAYLPDCGSYAPGRLLLDEMIRSSATLGLAAVDASRGSLITGNLLSDWTDEAVEHVDLWIFNRSLRGRLAHLAEASLKPTIRRWRARYSGKPAPGEPQPAEE